MTRIYVDLELLSAGGRRDASAWLESARPLEHLVEAGHEVLLVAEGSLPDVLAELGWERVGAAPAEPDRPAWYLTVDPERCRGRSARLRTVLVGAPPAPSAIHRCDEIARDTMAAVLEILAAEAMVSS